MKRVLVSLLAPWLVAGCVVTYDATRETDAGSEGSDDDDDDDEADDESDDDDDDCSAEEIECEVGCVDPRFDRLHCGRCDFACPDETACVLGECLRPCDVGCDWPTETCVDGFCRCRSGLWNCGGHCVDPRNDPDHCGDCDRPCGVGQSCGWGECVEADCPGFDLTCDRSCVDPRFDPLHCGGCDFECNVDELCLFRECVYFNELPEAVCFGCPCEEVCPSDEAVCCYSEYAEGAVCAFTDFCPE